MTEPTIAQTHRAFSMSCRVEANIRATATPTVSGVVPNERMTWTGGFAPVFKGVRTFGLTPRGDGSTDFVMEETFSGLMPLVKGSMPDFGPVFARFASDLKQEAERG